MFSLQRIARLRSIAIPVSYRRGSFDQLSSNRRVRRTQEPNWRETELDNMPSPKPWRISLRFRADCFRGEAMRDNVAADGNAGSPRYGR